MWEFTADTEIDCDRESLWTVLSDVEDWWPKSNPDHVELEVLSEDKPMEEGTAIRIEEYVAGFRGRGEGHVVRYEPPERVVWESPALTYRFLGLSVTVEEGVEWRLARLERGVVLGAHVWAVFPDTLWGRLAEFVAKRLMNGLQKDCEHAMEELRYLRGRLESEGDES